MKLPQGKILLVKNCNGAGWWKEDECYTEPHPWVKRLGDNPMDWKWYWCPGQTRE